MQIEGLAFARRREMAQVWDIIFPQVSAVPLRSTFCLSREGWKAAFILFGHVLSQRHYYQGRKKNGYGRTTRKNLYQIYSQAPYIFVAFVKDVSFFLSYIPQFSFKAQILSYHTTSLAAFNYTIKSKPQPGSQSPLQSVLIYLFPYFPFYLLVPAYEMYL